jgi:hypothetical protein
MPATMTFYKEDPVRFIPMKPEQPSRSPSPYGKRYNRYTDGTDLVYGPVTAAPAPAAPAPAPAAPAPAPVAAGAPAPAAAGATAAGALPSVQGITEWADEHRGPRKHRGPGKYHRSSRACGRKGRAAAAAAEEEEEAAKAAAPAPAPTPAAEAEAASEAAFAVLEATCREKILAKTVRRISSQILYLEKEYHSDPYAHTLSRAVKMQKVQALNNLHQALFKL